MRNAECGMRNGRQFLQFRIPHPAFRIGYNGRMDLSATLELLAKEPAAPVDLAEVALLIARDEYPDLHVEDYLKQLDGLAHEGRSYLGSSIQSQVAGLCRFLFHDVGFGGNQKEYYDPRNSYLNEVLDRLTGIPITLSLLTIA